MAKKLNRSGAGNFLGILFLVVIAAKMGNDELYGSVCFNGKFLGAILKVFL